MLAGGHGTRIAEETSVRPKPMVEIGGRPILWHIMKIYAAHGIEDFVILAGYKGHVIREYIANYALNSSDVTFGIARGDAIVHSANAGPWADYSRRYRPRTGHGRTPAPRAGAHR